MGSPGQSPPLPAPPAPSPPPKTPITVRAAAARRAHQFQQTYFSTSAGVETDGTRLLKGVSGKLDQPGAAKELLDILSDRESANISTFEFLSSGCVEQLEAYLLGELLAQPAHKHMMPAGQGLGDFLLALLHLDVWQAVHAPSVRRIWADADTNQLATAWRCM